MGKMRARDKYIKVFGKIDSLSESIPWSTGVSNMLEWLTWSTNDILGITKTQYRKLIVKLSHDEEVRESEFEEKLKYVSEAIDTEILDSEKLDRYEKPASSIASPREALRRAKFFSEDYLNKEFDIFWTLVSDSYLDKFYSQFTKINGGGKWYTHGNSGLFACSADIREMQMDNLSYNSSEKLLIANELKLGGKKNPDQILKYALMFKLLKDRNFIDPDASFLLLFIGDKEEKNDWNILISAEIEYCEKSSKSTAKSALQPECLDIANKSQYSSATWSQLLIFNKDFMSTLDMTLQQVEYKLLWGFNESLSAKAFMKK